MYMKGLSCVDFAGVLYALHTDSGSSIEWQIYDISTSLGWTGKPFDRDGSIPIGSPSSTLEQVG